MQHLTLSVASGSCRKDQKKEILMSQVWSHTTISKDNITPVSAEESVEINPTQTLVPLVQIHFWNTHHLQAMSKARSSMMGFEINGSWDCDGWWSCKKSAGVGSLYWVDVVDTGFVFIFEWLMRDQRKYQRHVSRCSRYETDVLWSADWEVDANWC